MLDHDGSHALTGEDGVPVREFIETQQSMLQGVTKKPVNRADSDQELVELVAKVLQSPQVLSAAQSLIARASEALAAKPVHDEEP